VYMSNSQLDRMWLFMWQPAVSASVWLASHMLVNVKTWGEM